MSISIGREIVKVDPEEFEVLKDMMSDHGDSVTLECPINGMTKDILSRSDNLCSLDPTELNLLIKFYDFFGFRNLDPIRKEVLRRTHLFFQSRQCLLDLDGIPHCVMLFIYSGSSWNIERVFYNPLLELLNHYVTFKGFNPDVIDNMNICSLDLSTKDVMFIKPVTNIHSLRLSYTKIEDVTMLSNIHTLDLSYTRVTDVSPLANVHTLNLSYTKVKDVSALTNVHTLDLSYTKVSDVSALTNVHTLDLSYTRVTDVSALTNVHTLNIRFTNVSDVSALTNVNTLNISGTRVTDVSMLANVRVLDISYTSIKDTSMLANVSKLIRN